MALLSWAAALMINVVFISADAEAGENEWLAKANAAIKAAVPLAEKDKTRPAYHFRPPAQWMNDICGAIHYQGVYHAFYQYNPFSGDRWGADYSLWGHASSTDLVHWKDQDRALLPRWDQGERRCNSGCPVWCRKMCIDLPPAGTIFRNPALPVNLEATKACGATSYATSLYV